MGIKRNEEADKASKQAIDMQGMVTIRLPYTDYLTIRTTRNSKWQREWENSTSKLHYILPHIEEWENFCNSCMWKTDADKKTLSPGVTQWKDSRKK